ncbi:MAG: hypothetical protein ACK5O9_06235 [Holosporales bacterium]|jgi:hypothetical protein
MDRTTFKAAVQEVFPDQTFSFVKEGGFVGRCENFSVSWNRDEGFLIIHNIKLHEEPWIGSGETLIEALEDFDEKICIFPQNSAER